MAHVERIPQVDGERVVLGPRPELSPAVKAMLRHAAGVFEWDRPDLAGPSEEGLRRARHARWGLSGMGDESLMEDDNGIEG